MSGKLTNKYFQPWPIHQLQDNQVVTSTKKRSLPGVKCDKHSINIRLKQLSNLDIRYFTLGGAFRLYFYKVSLLRCRISNPVEYSGTVKQSPSR